jgi:hypothetical protein
MEAMMKNRSQLRQLKAECLEQRSMMAGDIAASVEGGILYLRGDAAANGLLVQQGSGGIEIVGQAAGGSATTINGSASFVATGVTRGVTARLAGGNDSIRLANPAGPVTLPGGILVDTGDGSDQISGRINNGGAVTLNLGKGADKATLGPSSLGTLAINTDPFLVEGSGNDQVTLTGVKAVRAAAIRTGAGHDSVKIDGNSSFPLSLTVSVDGGNDRVEILGTAADPLAIGGALTVNTGRGSDVANIQHVNVNGVATVSNFDGNARITLNHVKARDGLFAYLGGGDDALTVKNSSGARAVLVGGLGQDSLTLESNSFGWLERVSF